MSIKLGGVSGGYRIFTDADIKRVGDYVYIYVVPGELRRDPLPWQVAGRQETASGYGAGLRTEHKLNYCGKWRRVYCDIYGNSGVCYVTIKGARVGVSGFTS